MRDEDKIIVKICVSSFAAAEPNLLTALKGDNVTLLILMGVSTDNAVQLTARDSYDRNFTSTILKDCCAAATDHLQDITLELMN